MRALASQSPDLDVGQVRTYATGAIARAGSTSIVLVQDVDGRFKLVSFAPRFAEAPVALGARPDASTRAAIAALRRDDCEEFFRFFMAYRPGGARAAQVCELRWLEDLGAALRRSDADPKVARLGGDGYVGFYGVHVGHRAWTAVLFAGEDRWYRISTIVRSRSDPDPGPEKP